MTFRRITKPQLPRFLNIIERESGILYGLGSMEAAMDAGDWLFWDDGADSRFEHHRVAAWLHFAGGVTYVQHAWGPSRRWLEILRGLRDVVIARGWGTRAIRWLAEPSTPMIAAAVARLNPRRVGPYWEITANEALTKLDEAA